MTLPVQLTTEKGVVVPLNEDPTSASPGYTPGYPGQTAVDQTSGTEYVSTGVRPSDWVAVGSGGGSQPSARWRKVATVTFADTPTDGTVIDLVTLGVGAVISDINTLLTTAWDDGDVNATLTFGFGLDGMDGKWIGSDSSWPGTSSTPIDISHGADDDARMSGNENTSKALSAQSVINQGANSYFPSVATESTVIQAQYNATGTAPTVGSADIWMLIQDAP